MQNIKLIGYYLFIDACAPPEVTGFLAEELLRNCTGVTCVRSDPRPAGGRLWFKKHE